ncbi:hypothetical protein BQ8482_370014 [Mesorhizobium delmotii]|uniref:Uncharacterized protein n=1 Tax=Mesorhizobium delmotii TaxID=1631247 RepID=A0A2P9ARN4_9HYPH|nr:hypothetical protein BQ8482_370014 [Mesorhizobium delmotii]
MFESAVQAVTWRFAREMSSQSLSPLTFRAAPIIEIP